MKFLSISESTTLEDLGQRIGYGKLDSVLSANGLVRSPKIGKHFIDSCVSCISNSKAVSVASKVALLNNMYSDSDVFEKAALLGEDGWKLLSNKGVFIDAIKIPESVQITDSSDTLGDGKSVSRLTYTRAMKSLKQHGKVDPSVFSEYSTSLNVGRYESASSETSNPFSWFQIPWGDITLHSSLSDESKDFPVYPEDLSDSVSANYTTMPDILYQYEPWQVYESSGPRSNTYTFKFHRDMWSGDHKDGKANELVRFCKANCYPDYSGSAVNTSICTLYVKGQPHIRGVITNVSDNWSGPIGSDGWYLHCELSITITEVSDTPITYSSMMKKGIIG